jgi:small ligand-binding sensory domain FIST
MPRAHATQLLSVGEAGTAPRLPDDAAPWAESPDLLLLHGSADLRDELTAVAADWRRRYPGCHVIGCTAETAIGGGREFEEMSAITALALSLPDAEPITFGLEFVTTREGNAFVGWPDRPDLWDRAQGIVALGDPFSFPMDAWLARMNEDHPDLPIVGGMCSGGHEPGGSRLIIDDTVLDSGAAFVVLRGDFRVDATVSQGCRPIGEPAVVTKAERNAVLELDGRPALRVLHELFRSLPTGEQEIFRHGLQLSKRIDEPRSAAEAYLVRNVVGIEPELQGIVVGDYFETGTRVRFELRDERAAHADLDAELGRIAGLGTPPVAAVVYSCNGRGSRLFSVPDHDAAAVARRWPGLPQVGCHAAGEIGPIAGRNFFHGFAAALLTIGSSHPAAES